MRLGKLDGEIRCNFRTEEGSGKAGQRDVAEKRGIFDFIFFFGRKVNLIYEFIYTFFLFSIVHILKTKVFACFFPFFAF